MHPGDLAGWSWCPRAARPKSGIGDERMKCSGSCVRNRSMILLVREKLKPAHILELVSNDHKRGAQPRRTPLQVPARVARSCWVAGRPDLPEQARVCKAT